MTSATPIKTADPRYAPGVSANDDDMTDQEWVAAMGPAPVQAPAGPRDNPAARAWAAFQENAAGHELTVLHDQGLYRHFRMAAKGTLMWSWDIVTWPGHLATSGDIADGLTFSRELDMIGFFGKAKGNRPYYSDGAPSIDFRYWAEKLQGDQRSTTRAYVHEDFLAFVADTLTERLEDDYDSELTRERVDELIAEAKDLEHWESEARGWLEEHSREFPDSWENDFKDYTFQFQLACYAVNAAVHAYLGQQARGHALTGSSAPSRTILETPGQSPDEQKSRS